MRYEEDAYYINQVIAGNSYAYSHLINKHKTGMFNLAMKIVRNRESAEEIVMDGFLKAYNALNSFQLTAKFSTWLYKIVYNTAISSLRKYNPEKFEIDEYDDFLEDDSSLSPFENMDNIDKKKFIDNALNTLTAEDRAIVLLYYFDGKALEEIAEITNLVIANIKTKLFRSRKKLYFELNKILNKELVDWV